MRMSFSPKSESKSVSVPVAVYAIIIIGTTVSFAGKPSIKAVNMTPSSPMSFANGSSAPEKADNRLSPRTVTFAASQIIMPAGAATAAALPRTKRVLSKIERTMTFKTCGFLYGGISRVNDDGTPRRSVFDSIRDETKVKSTLNTITSVKSAAVNTERHMPKLPAAKNMVIILMSDGKRPLQGTRQFVITAISFSRGLSIMRSR